MKTIQDKLSVGPEPTKKQNCIKMTWDQILWFSIVHLFLYIYYSYLFLYLRIYV